jgi:sodium transport system ATP-binding protein
MKVRLEVKNLTKQFKLTAKARKEHNGERYLVAVKDLSFKINDGEIYGLLGPNGAGKTTTLRMISTMIKPTKGEIYFDGEDINKNLYKARKKIGFLTSELKLDDFFTPDYMFSYMSSLYGLTEEEISKNKKKFFDKFGIWKFKDQKVGNLSTGQKQKISLAVALSHDPDIIIFDEPTNGLDVITAKEVEDCLLDLKKEGKTIIVSTHIFSLVEKLCDRVGIIFDGTLVKEGYLKDIVSKDKNLESVFFDLYNARKK